MLTVYYYYRRFTLDGILAFFVLSLILYNLCRPKNERLRIWTFALLGTGVYFLLYVGLPLLVSRLFLLNYTTPPYWYYFLITSATAFGLSAWLLRGNLFSKLTYILFFMALVQLYKIACSPLFLAEATMPRILYAFLDVLSALLQNALLFLLWRFFAHFPLNSSVKMSVRDALPVLYFPVSILILSIVLAAYPTFEHIDVVLSIIILTNLPIVFYMISRLITAYEEQRRMDAALAESQAELDSYRVTKELRSELRKERHEIKNRYFYLQTLLKDGKYEEAESYIGTVIGETDKSLRTIETGDSFLDYLLTRKLTVAKKAGIETTADILLPTAFSVDRETLCTVLSNILDNAIEAEEGVAHPQLRIMMKCAQGYFVAKVANRVEQNILEQNPELKSTKLDKPNHGFGMRIIRRAVEKQNGIFRIAVEHDFFEATVMLPLKK